jgi:dephospho-CoA kinase
MKKRIIAITGMPGARKSDATAIFAGFGISTFNMSTLIREEILKAGEVPTTEAYNHMGLELRIQYGADILAKRTLFRLPSALPFCIVDGVRTRAEVEYFCSNTTFFRVVCIHASQKTRFARMRARSGRELQEHEDLIRQDNENLALGLGEVIALADYVVIIGNYCEQPFQEAIKNIYNHLLQESSIII